VRALYGMHKSVDKDIYRMRAFVRFRKVDHEYVAWYRPDHRTLDANEQFFRDRFGAMRWAILTPYQSMLWDCDQIRYGPGVPREQAPSADEMDGLWRAYYSSIYNPARINPAAMRAQLPVRYWSQLPESRLIAPLRRESGARVNEMARRSQVPAQVPEATSLEELKAAVEAALPHAVFGEGPARASIMLVGEQPGDEEDRQGRPFVGPAGRVLDAAIAESGLERSRLYLTNAVKTFLYVERGKRRIHQTPRGQDIAANRPWLTAEISLVRPKVIVCLGATAGQSVFGRAVRIGAERGRVQTHPLADGVVLTYHPSAVLRAQEQRKADEIRQMLVSDLALARTASG